MKFYTGEIINGPTLIIEEAVDEPRQFKIRRALDTELEEDGFPRHGHTLFIIRDSDETSLGEGDYSSLFLTREQVEQVRDHLNVILEGG